MAVLKVLQYIHDNEGYYLGGTKGGVRRLENYANIYQLVAPYDSTSNLIANTLLASGEIVSDLMFLAKDTDGTQLYGKDVVDPSDPNYQDYTDWLVWDGEIGDVNFSKISKYRSGEIQINFSSYEIVEDESNLITDLGTFGSVDSTTKGDLPETSESVGDYYRCDRPTYVSTNADGQEFIYTQAAYWDGDSWEKTGTISPLANTEQTPTGVGPSVTPKLSTIDSEADLTTTIVNQLSNHEGRITTLEVEIDEKMPLDIFELFNIQRNLQSDDVVAFTLTDGSTKKVTAEELRNFISQAIDEVYDTYQDLVDDKPPIGSGTAYDGLNMVVIDASLAPDIEDRVDERIWNYNKSEGAWRNTQKLAQVSVGDFNALENRVTNVENRVTDIEDGTTIVEKAKRDQFNNIIDEEYVSKNVNSTLVADYIFTGNITHTGNIVKINPETIKNEDNIQEFNSNHTGVPTQDVGWFANRGDETNVGVQYQESSKQVVIADTDVDGNIIGGTEKPLELQSNKVDDVTVNPDSTTKYPNVYAVNQVKSSIESLLEDKEDISNKVTVIAESPNASDIKYPSEKASRNALDKKQDVVKTIANTGIIELDGVIFSKNQGDNTAVDYTGGLIRFVDNTDTINPTDVTLTVEAGTYNIPNISNDWLTFIYFYHDTVNNVAKISSQSTDDFVTTDFVYVAEVFHGGGSVLSVNQVGISAGANGILNLAAYITQRYINRAGNIYSPYTLLEMQRSEGFSVGPGVERDNTVKTPNELHSPLDQPSGFTLIYRDPADPQGMKFDANNGNFYSSWGDILFGGTNPISDYYDDGTGTLALKANVSNANNNRILLVPQIDEGANTFVILGQTDYANMTAATDAIDNNNESYDGIDSRAFNNSIDRSYLSIKRAATDLSDSSDARFKEITSGGGTTASQGGVTTTLNDTAINNTSTISAIQNYGSNSLDVHEGLYNDIQESKKDENTVVVNSTIQSTQDIYIKDISSYGTIIPVTEGSPIIQEILGETITQYLDNRDSFSTWTLSSVSSVINVNNIDYIEIILDGISYHNNLIATNLEDITQYSILCNIEENTTTGTYIIVNGSDLGTASVTIASGIDGMIKQTFTTGAIVTNQLRQGNALNTYAGIFTSRSVILKGDYTTISDQEALNIINNIEYGNDSVDNPTYKYTSKNIFDGEWEVGSFLSNGEEDSSTDRIRCKNYISVIGGEDYITSNEMSYGVGRAVEYDVNFNIVNIIGDLTSGALLQTNTAYLRWSYIGLTNPVTQEEVNSIDMLEIGTVSTDYTPYHTNTQIFPHLLRFNDRIYFDNNDTYTLEIGTGYEIDYNLTTIPADGLTGGIWKAQNDTELEEGIIDTDLITITLPVTLEYELATDNYTYEYNIDKDGNTYCEDTTTIEIDSDNGLVAETHILIPLNKKSQDTLDRANQANTQHQVDKLEDKVSIAGELVTRDIQFDVPFTGHATETKIDFPNELKPSNDETIITKDSNNDTVLLSDSKAGQKVVGTLKATNDNPGLDAEVTYRLYSDDVQLDTLIINLLGGETKSKSKPFTYVIPAGEAPKTLTVTEQVTLGSVTLELGSLDVRTNFTTTGIAVEPGTTDGTYVTDTNKEMLDPIVDAKQSDANKQYKEQIELNTWIELEDFGNGLNITDETSSTLATTIADVEDYQEFKLQVGQSATPTNDNTKFIIVSVDNTNSLSSYDISEFISSSYVKYISRIFVDGTTLVAYYASQVQYTDTPSIVIATYGSLYVFKVWGRK